MIGRVLAGAMILTTLAGAACAADPALVVGKWIEAYPGGVGQVTEFAPASVTTYSVDAAGKATAQPKTYAVSYKDLGGDSVAVVFSDGNGIALHRTGADSLLMDFPGAGAHALSRVAPPR